MQLLDLSETKILFRARDVVEAFIIFHIASSDKNTALVACLSIKKKRSTRIRRIIAGFYSDKIFNCYNILLRSSENNFRRYDLCRFMYILWMLQRCFTTLCTDSFRKKIYIPLFYTPLLSVYRGTSGTALR